MTPEEQKKFLDEQKRHFELLKEENNKHIADKLKGIADPLREEKVDRISAGMDAIADRIAKLEARSVAEIDPDDSKASEKASREAKAAMTKWMRKGVITPEEQEAINREVKAIAVGSE